MMRDCSRVNASSHATGRTHPHRGAERRDARRSQPVRQQLLGLSPHPDVVVAAHEALRTHGYGLSSVRFICGTQYLHKTLEARLSRFQGTEATILYAAAFDANGGLFEPLAC